MKKTPYYADLNEFWVIGDPVAKAFMGWAAGYHECYIDLNSPSRAEKFPTYREARKYMKYDKDAARWVEQHGGSRLVKPLRCRTSVVVYGPGTRP